MSDLNTIYENLKLHISENGKKIRKPLFISNFSKSRFRNHHFKYLEENAIPYFKERAGQAVKYSELCKLICDYIRINNLYLSNGNIKCDLFLKRISEKDSVSFIWLLNKFRMILQ